MKIIFEIAAAIMASVGASGVIIYGLSNWLGKVWANRLLEHDKLVTAKEIESTIRKRDIYAKLAVNMRVFLKSHDMEKDDRRQTFLEVYDEAFLWASDGVAKSVGDFIDLVIVKDTDQDTVKTKGSEEKKQKAYTKCLLEMRKDAGYPKTKASYRIVSF